jgi:hypothetical protein
MPGPVPFADPGHYAVRTGQTLDSTQMAQVGVLLDEASALLRERVSDLDARLAAGTLAAAIPKGIVCDMVFRYIANPTRASSVGTGPFVSTYASVNARGLYVTDDELAALAPASAAGAGAGVGSIRLGLPVSPRRR